MDTTVEQFNSLILREFMLEPNLSDEYGIGQASGNLVKKFSPQAVDYIARILQSSLPISIPQTVFDEVGKYVSEQSPLIVMGGVRGIKEVERIGQGITISTG